MPADYTWKALLVNGKARPLMTSIGISGHQNIPLDAQDYIRAGIEQLIHVNRNDLIGVSALAAGADQIFADILLKFSGRLHVVIQCREYESSFSEENDLRHFNDLLNRAETVEVLNHLEPSEEAYLETGHRVADLSDFLVAVWYGKPAKGKGGKADIVRYAKDRGIDVQVVWPSGVTH